jgi:multidrug efflux pump subunit AcrB
VRADQPRPGRLYTLSLLAVFLCLAALYDSWIIATAVLLVAPLGILGTVLAGCLLAVWTTGMGVT